jgi:hypothetical protein
MYLQHITYRHDIYRDMTYIQNLETCMFCESNMCYNQLNNFIAPQRLVYVKIENNCMFCQYPEGPVYGRYVDIEANYGYIHCNKCHANAEDMVNIWNIYFAYGRVKYLKNEIIKIKRSSGLIESGWRINSPLVLHDCNNNEIIHCMNDEKIIFRWCLVNDLIELNQLA